MVLQEGDLIVTSGGLVGTVEGIREEKLFLRTGTAGHQMVSRVDDVFLIDEQKTYLKKLIGNDASEKEPARLVGEQVFTYGGLRAIIESQTDDILLLRLSSQMTIHFQRQLLAPAHYFGQEGE